MTGLISSKWFDYLQLYW